MNENNNDLIDEQEYDHFRYRQDRKHYNESDEEETVIKKDRKGGAQKNEHLKDKYDFMVNFWKWILMNQDN